MKFKITPTKLVGLPDPSGWVLIHDFTPANNETFFEKGRLIAVLSMGSINGEPLPLNENLIVGKEIILRFHEEYYNTKGNVFDLLQATVQKISESFTSPNEKISILASVFLDNKVAVVSTGNVEAWVLRDSQLAKLENVTGHLQNNDKFFFGTTEFFSKITLDLLKSPELTETIKAFVGSTLGIAIVTTEAENEMPLPQLETKETKITQPIPVNPVKKPISPFRILIAKAIDRIISILPTKENYIRSDLKNPENDKKRKTATIAGFILLLLLVVSIFFGIKQKSLRDTRAKYEPKLLEISHNLNEAKNLSSVNDAKARDLILKAKDDINSLKKENIKDIRIDTLATEVENALGQIAGIYQDAPVLFRDLSLQSSGFKGDDLALSDDRLVVLDKAGKRLVSVNLLTKSTNPEAGPDIMPNAYKVGAYSDRNFVTSNNGVWEIGAKAGIAVPKDDEINENSLIAAYAGNIYLLNKNNSKVWRYPGEGGAFMSKQNWFGAGIEPDLSDVISWVFDGNIWMLTRDGDILRFGNGSPINFSLKNMDKDVSGIDITTIKDSKYLYILDSGNSRVLIVDKEGKYKAQYINEKIKDTIKIAVSEKNKKIILLQGSNLYSLDIKHL